MKIGYRDIKRELNSIPEILSYIAMAPIVKKRRGNNGRNRKKIMKACVGAFDIETSTKDDLTWMYSWQVAVDDLVYIGTTWSEFIEFMDALNDLLGSMEMIFFVHNLSYEWQFIKSLHEFEEEDVFLMDSRKPLYIRWRQVEFRCSYKLTNMSLARFLREMGVEHQKIEGDRFDYDETRYPDALDLEEVQWSYMIHDVLGLTEAVRRKLQLDGDTLLTMPYTSTGYVRRDVKKAMRRYSRQSLKATLPDYELFLALREAFRGGNTHANRWYAGEIQGPGHGYDKGSSYPDSGTCDGPMGSWSYMAKPSNKYVADLMKAGRAVLIRARLWNVDLKNRLWGAPYIPVSKCRDVVGEILDNGRILQAKMLEMTFTDLDFWILLNEYRFNIEYIEVWHARYDKLPKPIRECIRRYFRGKTTLKGLPDREYEYRQSKAKLNSIYGMMVQNPLRDQIRYVNGEELREQATKEDYEKVLKKAFLSYAWGVWITARSRLDLERAIIHVQNEGGTFLYCDTDSVKYTGDVEWSAFNERYIKRSTEEGFTAIDAKGQTRYLGLWEDDGAFDRFLTLGAKKYAYEEGGDLHVTIAGVDPKKAAGELGTLENMVEGFKFSADAAGLEAKYVDDQEFETVTIDGHRVELTSYVKLAPGAYTLGLTGEYRKLLNDPAWYLDAFDGYSY